MDPTIVVALISLCGTLVGTFGGITMSTKLTLYRIEQLEKKVDRFTQIETKIHELESHNRVQDERTKNIYDDISDLKRG